ncbi:alginate O-acetyltransferase [Pseudomonas rubra]|uniref:Probable alginate O-acetylase AlgJ n=1 Tax=Pseudomonas rubra TaxID=2942627 RepID=A0ABT5PEI9_9PSED|nr:alginate O-acetyltransferase [Pseudomonas rubra]MDD1016673.1 alginate O-acetyltransferase [Pseudomonas rubra]MDD1040985.1 alginate O-acetyltransferase [Pseudomonas rubra]MDD1153541.1 alginate O-acetyltransferase [Pseudomonas rubra]
MTRSLRKLYSLLFLALLLGLGLWSLGGLGSFQRSAQMTALDGKLAKAAETHYDEQFPLKRIGTNLWAALDFKLFNEGRPGVVLGREHWLFSDEEFKPVANSDQFEQENLALIRGVRDTLQQRGVQLVLAIVPAKARLYPEYLGAQTPASLHSDLYNEFHAQARQAGVFAPDLLAPLQEAKARGQVFLRTDSHWTPMGAEVVAQHLAAAVARQTLLNGAPQLFVTEQRQSAPYKGDLTNFLPLDPLFSNLLPPPDTLQKRSTRPAHAAGASGDALFADTQIPVVLIGTSYSANPNWNFLGALQQALRSDVVNYAEDGHGPLLPMLKYLQTDAFKNSAPQLLIWEFPERYLPMKNDLSAFDPQWIAQLKKTRNANQDLALSSHRTEN